MDDGSTDGTAEAIKKSFPEVQVLEGNGELWWTGAINLALSEFLPLADKEDYFLTLNNDVEFDESYLENLVFAAKQKPNALIGSVSLDIYDKTKVVDAGVPINWLNQKRTMGNFKKGDFFNLEVSRLSGRGALIPAQVFRKIGLYDFKHFPQYAADAELSVRAKNAGYHLCVYYDAILLSDRTISGLKHSPLMKVTIKQAYDLLFSIKSVSNIKTRFNVARFMCPSKFRLINYLYESLKVFFVITSIPPIYYIKIGMYNGYKLFKK
jgi:GT2 family glycosyltransferase